jgi:predicted phosphodiesterase
MPNRATPILIGSDFHLERRRLKEIPKLDQSFDVLVSAGDLWEGHLPLADCADAYRNSGAPWWAPAFCASEILPLLPEQMQPNLQICGHVHAPYDAQCGRIRVVCNPVEGVKFNPNLMIEI